MNHIILLSVSFSCLPRIWSRCSGLMMTWPFTMSGWGLCESLGFFFSDEMKVQFLLFMCILDRIKGEAQRIKRELVLTGIYLPLRSLFGRSLITTTSEEFFGLSLSSEAICEISFFTWTYFCHQLIGYWIGNNPSGIFNLKIIKTGVPGWLSWLNVHLWLRSWSHSSWVLTALCWALCWQLGAWILHQILCVCLSHCPSTC